MKMLNNLHIPILLVILVLVVLIFRRMKKEGFGFKTREFVNPQPAKPGIYNNP